MNDHATSLDRLHDLALPPEVSWWPLAPGWHFVVTCVGIIAFGLAVRLWKRRQANAYRRAALRELQQAQDLVTIAEVLRRTALAVAPRSVIAASSGRDWVDWLAQQIGEPVPDEVRTELASGIYSRRPHGRDIEPVRAFAARWISCHRPRSC